MLCGKFILVILGKNVMLNKKPTVIILCGGKGMRLRPITNDLPKPLIPISGKPVLHYIINQ